MSKVLEFSRKTSHLQEHRNLYDALVKLVYEFDAVVASEEHLPTRPDGHIDLQQVPISILIQWTMLQAVTPGHEHGENNEIITRFGRDTGDRGPDCPSL